MGVVFGQFFRSGTNILGYFADSKGLIKSVKEQKLSPDETLVCFDVSALFSSIQVPVALENINRKFTEHINQTGMENFLENTCFIPKFPLLGTYPLVEKICGWHYQHS